MNHRLSHQFRRVCLVLFLCLAGLAIAGGTLALPRNDIQGAAGNILGHPNAAARALFGGPITTTTIAFLPVMFDPGADEPPSGDDLTDGGVIRGVDGVSIGAVPGTLTSSLAVTISQTTAPTLTLPGGAQAHGHYYSLSAERGVFTLEDGALILGLPVPTGVTADHLGVALFDTGGGDEPAGWFVLPGLYDPAGGLLLVQLPVLDQPGQTAVLVEHQGLSSPPNTAPSVQPAATAGSALFSALCMTDDLRQEDCLLEKHVVEQEFKTFYDEMSSLGYPDPLIIKYAQYLSLDGPSAATRNVYVVTIAPDVGSCEEGVLGTYRAAAKSLSLCFLPSSFLLDTQRQIVRHEYYHATQAAFPLTYDDKISGTQEKWISEGTATVAELSNQSAMRRDPGRSLHHVDRALTSTQDTDEYRAQDFWAFLGQAGGPALVQLITLFEKGVTTDDVVSWIGSEDGFKNWYWRWVKNQVMVEENITFDGILGPQCTLQAPVVETLRSFDLYNEGFYQGTLPPLTSHVVKIEIAPELEGLPQLMVWLNQDLYGQMPDPDLKYKVYVDGETCTSIPDGFRILYDITAAKDYYVVVSNSNRQNPRAYTIWFD